MPRLPGGLGDAADADVGDAGDEPGKTRLQLAPVITLAFMPDRVAKLGRAVLRGRRLATAAEDRGGDPVHHRPLCCAEDIGTQCLRLDAGLLADHAPAR